MSEQPDDRPNTFWDETRRGRLAVQQCTGCRRLRHYPQPLCPECRSAEFTWFPVTGRGRVHTWTTTHRAFTEADRGRVPYTVAVVELDEGPRMVARIPGEADITFGTPVEVCFETGDDDRRLPNFRITPDEGVADDGR
ncbi:Zn-ribbon domain-containing OB-fold protein [Enemella sp. A6]|uniref:Zn-ribbon domain-containing OB-fold protein n=1 Tax=Enemella sp. A6 TaxID=3440152 RepID=UPI003EC0EAA0